MHYEGKNMSFELIIIFLMDLADEFGVACAGPWCDLSNHNIGITKCEGSRM